MNGTKKFFRSLGFSALLVVPSAVVLGPGCTIGKTVCDLQCDCVKCSDRAFDDCVDSTNAAVDTADAYGCRAELDAYVECFKDNFDCDEKENQIEGPDADDCGDESEDLAECIDDASDHGSGSGPGATNATTDASTTATGTTDCCTCSCSDTACGITDLPTGCAQSPCDCPATCTLLCESAACGTASSSLDGC